MRALTEGAILNLSHASWSFHTQIVTIDAGGSHITGWMLEARTSPLCSIAPCLQAAPPIELLGRIPEPLELQDAHGGCVGRQYK